jgi:hypothetical protein
MDAGAWRVFAFGLGNGYAHNVECDDPDLTGPIAAPLSGQPIWSASHFELAQSALVSEPKMITLTG